MNGTMNLPHFNRTHAHPRARPRSIRQSAARAWWLALGLFCASPSAFAYDLWQAYQDAQVNDPTYLSDIAQKEVYDAQKKQARAAMMPTVLVGAGIYKTRKQFWQSPLPDTRTTPANVTVSLNQPILELDKITGFRQLSTNVQIGDLKLAQAKQDLITRVVQAYFSAWLADHNVQVAKDVLTASERQYQMAQKNFEVGNTTIIDTQEAQTVWHNAQATLINAKASMDNAKSNLESVVGHPITEPLAGIRAPLKLKMPVPDTSDKWVARANEANYNIKMAQLGYKVADLETTRMAQQRLPKVSIVASYRWSKNSTTTGSLISDDRNSLSTIGLELSMPIFDGGMIGAQVLEAEANKTISGQSLRATQINVAQSTRVAYNQAVSGLATITALESAQTAAQKSSQSNLLGYQLGMRINVDVLNAQNTYAQAQYNLAQAQYNTILGNVNLKSAIADLKDEDVRYINDLLSTAPPAPATTGAKATTKAANASEPKPNP